LCGLRRGGGVRVSGLAMAYTRLPLIKSIVYFIHTSDNLHG